MKKSIVRFPVILASLALAALLVLLPETASGQIWVYRGGQLEPAANPPATGVVNDGHWDWVNVYSTATVSETIGGGTSAL